MEFYGNFEYGKSIIDSYETLNLVKIPWEFTVRDSSFQEIQVDRKWQDYVYIQCEYKSTKQKIKHLLREENKVKENKIS